MLRALRVGNLALVDELELRLEPGLTMITGETGAGKSLVAGALALLAGRKADKGLIRRGTELAFVEGVFDLAERPEDRDVLGALGVRIAADGILVLRREMRSEGRGRTLINGLVSSLALLEQIGERLLAIQSQDQQRELARPAFAGEYLDRSLGLEEELDRMAGALELHRRLAKDLARRRQEEEFARQQLEMWEYQHRELTEAGLDAEEPARLTEQLALGRDARSLMEGADTCRTALSDGEWNARAFLGTAESALTPLAGKSPRLDSVLQMIREAAANASEAAADLERFLDQLELDPARLDEIEERDSLYRELMRKYDRDVEGLIELCDDLAERIRRQAGAAADLTRLQEEVEEARADVARQAELLFEKRRTGAPGVAREAVRMIRELALPQLELEFRVDPAAEAGGWVDLDGTACAVGVRGADQVGLWVRANPGESFGEAGRVASGGERSRIFLGLSVLDSPGGRRPLQLYDEIDAGLGMDNAVPVAALLERLAERGQVLCITHLPTVACRGASHWRVHKTAEGERTVVRVEDLDKDGRLRETARLLGGEAVDPGSGDSQLDYARRLLEEGGRAARGEG